MDISVFYLQYGRKVIFIIRQNNFFITETTSNSLSSKKYHETNCFAKPRVVSCCFMLCVMCCVCLLHLFVLVCRMCVVCVSYVCCMCVVCVLYVLCVCVCVLYMCMCVVLLLCVVFGLCASHKNV